MAPSATARFTCSSSRSAAATDDSGASPSAFSQHLLGELVQEVVVDALGDDDPLGGVARLPGVLEAAVDRGLHGGVQVVGAQHDERIGAAELEHDLLQVAARDLGDRRARALRAGQRNPLHAWVGDDVRDLLVGGVDVDVGALGVAGVGEDLLHRRRRFGALRSVLEHDGVAQRQVRAGEPGDLVVGVVPRHDAEQHADRAAPDQRGALAVDAVRSARRRGTSRRCRRSTRRSRR